MKKRGRFEAASFSGDVGFQVSRYGKYLEIPFIKKRTSRYLQMMVSSAVSMLLCCTMFLSTTMAWFTDSVITAGNQIVIGTLAVDITCNGVSLNPNKNENPPKVFSKKDNTTWQPGDFVVEELTIVNTGDLPIVYELTLLPSDTALAQYFQVFVPAEDYKNATLEDMKATTNDEQAWTSVGPLSGFNTAYKNELDAVSDNEQPKTDSIIIGLKMMPLEDSSINTQGLFGKNFTLYIKLLAYQKTANTQDIAEMDDTKQNEIMTAIAEEEEAKKAAEEEAKEVEENQKSQNPIVKSPVPSNTATNFATGTDDDVEDDIQTSKSETPDGSTQTGNSETPDGTQTGNSETPDGTQTGNSETPDGSTQTGNSETPNGSTQTNNSENLNGETQTDIGNDPESGIQAASETGYQDITQTDAENSTQTIFETTSEITVSGGEETENN